MPERCAYPSSMLYVRCLCPWMLGLIAFSSVAATNTPEAPLEGTQPAPEFPTHLQWLNTDKPLSLTELKGKVVLLDFWTYCCINCMHVIPDLKKLEAKYPKELVVIGVHSAKFQNEQETDNIRHAILRYEIEHPVINDRDFEVWRAYGARAWPTLILINPAGRIIGYLSGEGIYETFDEVIGATIKHFDARKQIDRTPLQFKLERNRTARPLFAYPGKIAADEKSRRLFFSDSNHNRLIVSTLDGEILEVIGEGERGLRDGDFATARFFRPQGLCFDAEKNVLYVTDTENHAIRKVDLNKKSVETLAGTGQQARRRNTGGVGQKAELNSPWDLVLIGDTLYVAMAGAHQLWTINVKTREAKVHAGTGREDIVDASLDQCALAQPSGMTTDGKRLYFADSEVSAVRTADLKRDGRVETLIGQGLFKFGDVDGKYPDARLQHCIGVAWHDGFVYVADTYNHKIKRVNPDTKELTTFIGTGKPGATDGARTSAFLNEPNGLCFVKDTIYIADSNNHLIRTCNLTNGQVSTVAFKGLDKLTSKKQSTLGGEEISLNPLRISPEAKTLRLDVVLPEGTKLNPAGPSKFKGDSSQAQVVALDFNGHVTGTKIAIPIECKPGQTVLSFDADIYYCSKENEGLCFFKFARLTLPVEVVEGGSVSPTVEFKLSK